MTWTYSFSLSSTQLVLAAPRKLFVVAPSYLKIGEKTALRVLVFEEDLPSGQQSILGSTLPVGSLSCCISSSCIAAWNVSNGHTVIFKKQLELIQCVSQVVAGLLPTEYSTNSFMFRSFQFFYSDRDLLRYGRRHEQELSRWRWLVHLAKPNFSPGPSSDARTFIFIAVSFRITKSDLGNGRISISRISSWMAFFQYVVPLFYAGGPNCHFAQSRWLFSTCWGATAVAILRYPHPWNFTRLVQALDSNISWTHRPLGNSS